MSRRDDVRWLAPVAPPCFGARLLWVEFLTAAAEAQTSAGQPQVLILKAGQPVRFNFAFDWCVDCTAEYRAEMLRQKRCNPNHLREMTARESTDAAS